MPSVGLSSFLQETYYHILPVINTGVNALSRAFFISTEKKIEKYFGAIECQCPQSGFLHFYVNVYKEVGKVCCVNALSRAFFISTEQNS